MKKLWALLTVLALLAAAAAAFGETAGTPDLYDLYVTEDGARKWAGNAVPIMDGVTIASPSGVTGDFTGLEIWDGSAYRPVSYVLSTGEDSVLVLLHETDGAEPGIPAYSFLESSRILSAGELTVRSGDWMKSRINRAVYDLSGISWKNREALLLTLSGDTALGAPLVAGDGKLAGIIVAEYAEGANRYVALPVVEIAVCLQEASYLLDQEPETGNAPEGLTVTTEENLVTFNWAEMKTPEAGEGQALYLIVADSEADYLTYMEVHTGVTQVSMLLTPGRTYYCGLDLFEDIPDDLPEQFVMVFLAEAKPMTEYQFRSEVFAIAELPQDAPQGTMPAVTDRISESLLRSGRACIYSVSSYQVDAKQEDSTLLITLTDPEGNNYRYESGWYYDPTIMEKDEWYVTMNDTGLLEMLNANGYPEGTYEMAMYIDGKLADSFSFELIK